MRMFIAIFLALVLFAYWFTLEIRAKLKYDHARRTDFAAYSVTPMNQQTVELLAKVQTNWTCWVDVTNGPDTEMLKLVEMSPSVHNLIETFNYQMPPFRWFSPSQNRKAATFNLVKAEFMPVVMDKQWHVSADEHIAFLLCRTNVIMLYRDEPSGLRVSGYARKKAVARPPNVSQ